MQAAGAQAELFFWLTVEGYRVTAQQQLEVMQNWQKDGKKQPSATKGLLKAAALGVYEQYLSDKVGSRLAAASWSVLLAEYNSNGCVVRRHFSVCKRRLQGCKWTRHR